MEWRSDVEIGPYGGIRFHHVSGTLTGVVGRGERVAGLAKVAGKRGDFRYETDFDLILPTDPAAADGIVVEPTNRGIPLLTKDLPTTGSTANPARSDNDYLLSRSIGIARIQWQAGIAKGVPEQAQGVGEIIVRDFGRLLAGDFPAARRGLPIFAHRILAGVSQSAFFVNTIVAEGFNREPDTGKPVYQGLFTRDGNGVVLATNSFARGGAQSSYLPQPAVTLTPNRLFRRSSPDVVAVDLSAATDYYRLQAARFALAKAGDHLHRYATAASHSPRGAVPADRIFGVLKCHSGIAVPLNPVNDRFVVRALLLDLAGQIGTKGAADRTLPPDAPFDLVSAASGRSDIVRRSHGATWIPKIGADGTMSGGIVLPEARWPIGIASPPSLPPVKMGTISEVCGNFAGWSAYSADELRRRYGSRSAYMDLVRSHISGLVRQGYVLAEDAPAYAGSIMAELPEDFE